MRDTFELKIRRDQEEKTKAEIFRLVREVMERNHLRLLAGKIEHAIISCQTVHEG